MFNDAHSRRNVKSFKQINNLLKKRLPPAYPVKIQYVKSGSGYFGYVDLKTQRNGRKYFLLKISLDQCEDTAIETLMHEWAHIISWPVGNSWVDWREDHGPDFGVAYSKVYQVVIEK